MEKSESISFQQTWLCEAVCLRESQWGPQDDNKARRIVERERSPLLKVLRRAQVLSDTNGLTSTIKKLSTAGWLALVLIFSLAILSGASMAFASLGNGSQPVNIVWALFALLGLNTFSLALWCVSMLSPNASGGLLAQLWPTLTLRLARGPDVGLAVQAWWSIWRQAQATRWLLSISTHLIWMAILLGAAAAMVFALSTRQYDFVWETTVLSPDIFVKWVERLAVVPKWFGFIVPDEQLIRESATISEHHAEVARRLWSGWLLGCLVTYGLLPRVLLSLASALIVGMRIKRIRPDLLSPYYLAVLNRMPSSDAISDGLPPSPSVFSIYRDPNIQSENTWGTDHILIAIEPDPNDPWPPKDIGTAVTCIGPIDSRESRQHILRQTLQARPKNLVLACDARHSPDRGTVRLISDLSESAQRTLIWLRYSQAAHAHTEAWLSQLRALPEIEIKIRDDAASVMLWLERHHD